MKILFLCSSNVFRSQMAEAFFNKYSKIHKAESAALIKPQDKMHSLVIRAMKESGIDISKNLSKMITREMIEGADILILMNSSLQGIVKGLIKNKRVIFWGIPDVRATETDEHLYLEFVKARNVIEEKIKELLRSIE